MLFFVVLTGFIGGFQVFTSAYIATAGGPANSTMFFVLYLYNNAFRFFKMGYASAMAWVLFVIVVVFTAIDTGASATPSWSITPATVSR